MQWHADAAVITRGMHPALCCCTSTWVGSRWHDDQKRHRSDIHACKYSMVPKQDISMLNHCRHPERYLTLCRLRSADTDNCYVQHVTCAQPRAYAPWCICAKQASHCLYKPGWGLTACYAYSCGGMDRTVCVGVVMYA